jgi:hypothetical protein
MDRVLHAGAILRLAQPRQFHQLGQLVQNSKAIASQPLKQ